MRGSRSPVLPALDAVPPQHTTTWSGVQLCDYSEGGNPPELAQADSSAEMAIATDVANLFPDSNRISLNLRAQKRYLAAYLRDRKDLVTGAA